MQVDSSKYKSITITEGVVEYLKENILKGVWGPGEKISSENELAELLSVSRSSVRSAIQHLIAIGVLESFRGSGTFVKTQPIDDIEHKLETLYRNSMIEQLVEFRIIVEGESCRLAAQRMTEQSLNNLKIHLVNMMNNMSNREKFIAEDIAFHKEILKTTGNQLIVHSVEHIMHEIEYQHCVFNTEDKMENALEWHRKILVELEKMNGEGAAYNMKKHLEYSTKD